MPTSIEIQSDSRLDAILASNPEMEKKLKAIIRTILKEARKYVSGAALSHLQADQRSAYKAVKSSVYKAVLGGNISLLNRKKRSGAVSTYEPPRKLRPGQRGGNRRPRSERTQQMMSYEGVDRAFALRFSLGTKTRLTRYGNRGAVPPNNWFAQESYRLLENALDAHHKDIEKLIEEQFNSN